MKSKHLSFAKQHETYTVEEWNNVVFSNESTEKQFAKDKRNIRGHPGKRFDEIIKSDCEVRWFGASCPSLGKLNLLLASRNNDKWCKVGGTKAGEYFEQDQHWTDRGTSKNWSQLYEKLSKTILQKKKKQSSATEALRKVIKEFWSNEISVDYCNNLILRMPCRFQSVIKSKWDYAKYCPPFVDLVDLLIRFVRVINPF